MALKHALSAIIEGDDPKWSQAQELEASVAEYVARNRRVRFRYSAETGDGRRAIVDKAAVVAGSLLVASARDGRVLMADAQTGKYQDRVALRRSGRISKTLIPTRGPATGAGFFKPGIPHTPSIGLLSRPLASI